jgi:hypothetical protein
MKNCEVAMNEYPRMNDLALRILEVLIPIFPRDANFEDLVSALPGVNQDEILSRLDDMQKLGWVDGSLIRTGVDNSVKGVFRCHLTPTGRNWLQAQGIVDFEHIAELCELRFNNARKMVYDDIRIEFRPIMHHYEITGVHEFDHFAESTCELVFARLRRIKDAFLAGYLKTLQETPAGITFCRKLWLLRMLSRLWDFEIQQAKDIAQSLTGGSGLPTGKAHKWIANLEGRGRDLERLLENEIDVAALERAHRAPERAPAGTFIFGDQILNYGQAGAIGARSSGALRERLTTANRANGGVADIPTSSAQNDLVKPRHNVQCVGFELISNDPLSIAALCFQNVPTPGKLMGKFEFPRLRVIYYINSTGQEIADMCPLQWYGDENVPNEITTAVSHANIATFLMASGVWRLFEVNEPSDDFDDWRKLHHIEVPAGEYRIIAKLSGAYHFQLQIKPVFGVLTLRDDGTASFQRTDE